MTSILNRTISLTDLTFHYCEAGDSQKPALILLHIPDCKLVAIEGAEHNVHQNRLSEYLEIVQNFLF